LKQEEEWVFKAIWWGLAGLLLGLVLAAGMGAAMGAVAGTLIGAVLGAWPAVRKRCSRPSCKGCAIMCEPKSSGVSAAGAAKAIGGLVAVVVTVWAADALAPFLVPVAVVLVVLTVPAVKAVRWVAWRVTVPRDSNIYAARRQQAPPVIFPALQQVITTARAAARQYRARRMVRPAITTGPLAIEAPRPQVPGVILRGEVMERDVV